MYQFRRIIDTLFCYRSLAAYASPLSLFHGSPEVILQSFGPSSGRCKNMNVLSFHSLRRRATTLLHQAGVPAAVAQMFIGHDSETMHQIYVSVGAAALEKAAAAFPDLL
jgi:integrase